MYGVAPTTIILPRYSRTSRRWVAEIWAATLRPDGTIRWCAHTGLMYVCYTIMVHYCKRNKRDRNLYYELRLCRPISERDINRIVNVFRYPSIRRASGVGRAVFLRRVHEFINSVAYAIMDELYERFLQFVNEDSGMTGYIDAAEYTDSIEILQPRIEPPCGSPSRGRRRRRTPLSTLYYIYRCRCHATEVSNKFASKESLVPYINQAELQSAINTIRAAFVGIRIENIPELERFISLTAREYGLLGNCTNITASWQYFVRYARFVQSADFLGSALPS